jgi:hypothetical protein
MSRAAWYVAVGLALVAPGLLAEQSRYSPGAQDTAVVVRSLAVEQAPIAVTPGRPPVPGTRPSLSYLAENLTPHEIFTFTVRAFVFGPGGRPKGFQTQAARPGWRLLPARGRDEFAFAFNALSIDAGDLVILAPSRVVTPLGVWRPAPGTLVRQARELALARDAVVPARLGGPAPLLWSAAVPEQGCGPLWCQE